MLERALIYRVAFVKIKRMEKEFARPIPTEDEWVKIEKITALLKPFDDITTKFSGRNYPTANIYFPNVWRIETLLVNYCASEDETLKDMAKMMKGKFDKYWESYSVVLSFVAILDPRYKMHLVKYWFEQLEPGNGELKAKQVKDKLYKLFEEYTQSARTQEYEVCQAPIDGLAGFSAYTSAVARKFSELDLYLEESKLDHIMELDVLDWWKTNEKRLPEVARMAKDILSIPISTVASESSFSLGSRILTKWRASLKPDTEALVTTRSWVFGYQVDKDDDALDDGVEFHIRRYEDQEEDEEGEDDDVDSDVHGVEEKM